MSSLFCPASLHASIRILNRGSMTSPFLAGNSSPPSTLSGTSSGGVAATDGQYGFVTFFGGRGFRQRRIATKSHLLHIGLLRCTPVHACFYDLQYDRFRCYDLNKLSSEFRVSCLALYCLINYVPISKAWGTLGLVSAFFYTHRA